MRHAAAWLLLLAWACAAPAAQAAPPAAAYAIDQRFGEIGFAVHHLGLFSSDGTFRRFTGQLTIDEAHPQATRVAVDVQTGSAAVGWAEAQAMLRSPAYFDVARYPVAHFASTRVVAEGPDRYEVDGLLTLRGMTHPVVLQAALTGRHPGAEPGTEEATFVITGTLRRSEFGMVSDRVFVSDRVDLRIDARLRLAAAPNG